MNTFFLQNISEYKATFDFDYEINLWNLESSVITMRYIADIEHPTCMQISSETISKGIYQNFNVFSNRKYVIEFAYKNEIGQKLDLLIYDNNNGINLLTETLTETDWSNYYNTIDISSNCSSIIIYFRAGTNSTPAKKIYIDDIIFQGNAMVREPDEYTPSFPINKNVHQTVNRFVYDYTNVTYRANLSWNFLPDEYFQQLLSILKSGEAAWFDDGNVPAAIEQQYLFTETLYNFAGIINPSATHKAYYTLSKYLPTASNDFEDNEYSTLQYNAIDEDDINYAEHTCNTLKNYMYAKYNFKMTEYSKETEVKSIAIKIKCSCEDTSNNGIGGVTLYGYSDNIWLKLVRSRASDLQTLTFTTERPEQAQALIDFDTGYIRLILRSNGMGISTGSIVLKVYYVEVIINNKYSTTIYLSNKALLQDNDVIYVKNLTQGTILTLATDYRIKEDRQAIIVQNQSAGDLIEVKYNQLYNVIIDNLSERRLRPHSNSPNRQINLSLQSLLKI